MADGACLFLRRKQTYCTLESRHALDDPADASAAVAQPGDPDLRRPPGRLLCGQPATPADAKDHPFYL